MLIKNECKVLIIEDDKDFAYLLKNHLSSSREIDFISSHAPDLSTSFEALREDEFDIILLDLGLPDCSGLDSLKKINKQNFVLDIPIIILTSHQIGDIDNAAIRIGAQDYIVKSELQEHRLVRSISYAIERHEVIKKLQTLAMTDALTGLYNRHGAMILGMKQMEIALRSRLDVMLLYIDIDDLKMINDHFGHTTGDEVLRDAAKILEICFRGSDVISRIGGDEFTVLSLGSKLIHFPAIQSRLQTLLDSHHVNATSDYKLSMSIGIAESIHDVPKDLFELMELADRDLYYKKTKKIQANAE